MATKQAAILAACFVLIHGVQYHKFSFFLLCLWQYMNELLAFSIEPANFRDLSALQRLEKACFDLDAWSFLDLLGVLTLPAMVRFKAVIDQEMIGFAAGEIRGVQQTGWIVTIGVQPRFRRLGVARALLEICEQHLPVPRIRLCVRISNRPAIDLYQTSGYRQVEIWHQYYRGGEDALVMEKDMQA